MNTPLWCQSCGASRDRGQLLLVRDLRGVRPDAVICRPTSNASCLSWAGTVDKTSIALFDPIAARQWDHDHRDPHERDQNLRRVADAMRQFNKRPLWETA